MLDLESTIKHCEEMAEKNEEMCRVEELMGLGLQNTEMMKCARTHKQLGEWLKELKKLREQTRWIPTSERLPKYGIKVLTCSSGGFVEIQSLETYGKYWDNHHGEWNDFDEVIAWQPLPESYKPESEVKE